MTIKFIILPVNTEQSYIKRYLSCPTVRRFGFHLSQVPSVSCTYLFVVRLYKHRYVRLFISSVLCVLFRVIGLCWYTCSYNVVVAFVGTWTVFCIVHIFFTKFATVCQLFLGLQNVQDNVRTRIYR